MNRGKSKVQRAVYEVKALPLCGEWAYKVACEKFGVELVDAFPRFAHGPRKGKLKGYLCYIKTSVGGWANNLPDGRGVLLPGTCDWKLAMADQYSDPKEHSVVARWFPPSPMPNFQQLKMIQTPQGAASMFRTYGTEARYG